MYWFFFLIEWVGIISLDSTTVTVTTPNFSISERAAISAKHPSIREYFELNDSEIKLFAGPADKVQGKAESVIFMEEVDILNKIMFSYEIQRVNDLVRKKGTRKFNREKFQQLPDSPVDFVYGIDGFLPLKGCRIALDPGHFAGNAKEAIYESRLARIKMPDGRVLEVYEAELTYTTYAFLRDTLHKLGAEVFCTRGKHGWTAFGKSYTDWLRDDLETAVNARLQKGEITAAKAALLLKSKDPGYIYLNFFQQYELEKRAQIINDFKPHFTVIIHYNADAVNNRYDGRGNLLPTKTNYNMAFVPGAFIAGEMYKPEARINFVRLLVTNDIEESVELSMYLLESLNRKLKVESIPPESKLNYLTFSSTFTGFPGVYARNLALTRMVNGPVCYGESLYQDNINEIDLLANKTLMIDSIATSERVRTVAYAYLEGIMAFLQNKKQM